MDACQSLVGRDADHLPEDGRHTGGCAQFCLLQEQAAAKGVAGWQSLDWLRLSARGSAAAKRPGCKRPGCKRPGRKTSAAACGGPEL